MLLAVYTGLIVLYCIFPLQTNLFAVFSVILVSLFYLYRIAVPFAFCGDLISYHILGRWVGTVPILVLVLASIFVPRQEYLIWGLYFLIVLLAYGIPVVKALLWRLKIFFSLKKISKDSNYHVELHLSKILFLGRRSVYYIEWITPNNPCLIGILGNYFSTRYWFFSQSVRSQKVNGMIGKRILDLEKWKDNPLLRFAVNLFTGKTAEKALPASANKRTIRYLLLAPSCFIQKDNRLVELGECVNEFHRIEVESLTALIH